jgi:SAM-dependent methyltransferase
MGLSALYLTALLGPLAEQLVEVAGVAPGMRVVDVLGGAGILTRRVAATVGHGGTVVTVVDDAAAARALARDLRESRTTASVIVASAAALPFDDRQFDAAVSLLRLSGPGGAAGLREMERVADHAAAVVTGDVRALPEDLLARAWQEVIGDVPPGLRPAPAVLPPEGWTSAPIVDVVRFDSATQLMRSLCDHLAVEVPRDSAAAVSRRFHEGVAAFQGADGTLRIPIEVTLLRTVRA